jgi:hypothetical protein
MDRCIGACLDPNFSELFSLSLLRRLLEWLGIEEGDTEGGRAWWWPENLIGEDGQQLSDGETTVSQ